MAVEKCQPTLTGYKALQTKDDECALLRNTILSKINGNVFTNKKLISRTAGMFCKRVSMKKCYRDNLNSNDASSLCALVIEKNLGGRNWKNKINNVQALP